MSKLVIPSKIRSLLRKAKISVVEAFIISLIEESDPETGCYETNQFFASQLNISIVTFRRHLSKLREKNLLTIIVTKIPFQGGDQRILFINKKQTIKIDVDFHPFN